MHNIFIQVFVTIEKFGKKVNYVMRCARCQERSRKLSVEFCSIIRSLHTVLDFAELTPCTHGAAYETHITRFAKIPDTHLGFYDYLELRTKLFA